MDALFSMDPMSQISYSENISNFKTILAEKLIKNFNSSFPVNNTKNN